MIFILFKDFLTNFYRKSIFYILEVINENVIELMQKRENGAAREDHYRRNRSAKGINWKNNDGNAGKEPTGRPAPQRKVDPRHPTREI